MTRAKRRSGAPEPPERRMFRQTPAKKRAPKTYRFLPALRRLRRLWQKVTATVTRQRLPRRYSVGDGGVGAWARS
jgi:hypothetical protein